MTQHFTRNISTFILSALFLGLISNHASAATFQTIAITRQKAVSSPNLRYAAFGEASINDEGSLAYYASVYGGGAPFKSRSAIFIRFGKNAQRCRLIAQNGVSRPFNDTRTVFDQLGQKALINNSNLVLWEGLVGDTTYTAFLNLSNSSNQTFNLISILDVQSGQEPVLDLNDSNMYSFLALDTNKPSDPPTLFRADLDTFKRLVAVGNQAVGLPLGATYTAVGTPTLDEQNDVYFYAQISAPATSFEGLWHVRNSDNQNTARAIATLSTNAPTTGGAKFTAFNDAPIPSSNGTYCAFNATVDTINGIWMADFTKNTLSKVVKDGNRTTNQKNTLSAFGTPAINNFGNVAFLATGKKGKTSSKGLYFYTKGFGSISKLIAIGDDFNFQGQSVTVLDISFSSRGGLNNRNKLAVVLSFSNGRSGVFVVTP